MFACLFRFHYRDITEVPLRRPEATFFVVAPGHVVKLWGVISLHLLLTQAMQCPQAPRLSLPLFFFFVFCYGFCRAAKPGGARPLTHAHMSKFFSHKKLAPGLHQWLRVGAQGFIPRSSTFPHDCYSSEILLRANTKTQPTILNFSWVFRNGGTAC